jgi:hypothetical protein
MSLKSFLFKEEYKDFGRKATFLAGFFEKDLGACAIFGNFF